MPYTTSQSVYTDCKKYAESIIYFNNINTFNNVKFILFYYVVGILFALYEYHFFIDEKKTEERRLIESFFNIICWPIVLIMLVCTYIVCIKNYIIDLIEEYISGNNNNNPQCL